MDSAIPELTLTPHGRLLLSSKGTDGPLSDAFARGSGHGLLYLGADLTGAALPPAQAWWRDFGGRFVTAVCTQSGNSHVEPPAEELEWMALAAPPMTGAEYLTAAVLESLWRELDAAFVAELGESGLPVQDFLKARNPAWNLVGRVHFHLAENREDPELPFAFLATYTTRLAAHAKAHHLPLGQALKEYAGAANKDRMLSLLLPVQRAAEGCPWLKSMIEAGELFHPLRWSVREAMQLLNDVPHLEASGVLVRMPASWRGNRPPRPRVRGVVGTKPPSSLGVESLLDFAMEVTLDGQQLTEAEVRALLAQSEGLAMVRGRWVQVDREQLGKLIEQFRRIEQTAGAQGLGFAEAMRLLAGADIAGGVESAAAESADWTQVAAGPWLAEMLKGLRGPEGLAQIEPGEASRATLRPYQQVGVRWLYMLSKLGLGACLADDMGLGKTIQVLSLLQVLKRQAGNGKPSLLVAPASLLANWASEMEKFTPDLRPLIAHPSAMPPADWKVLSPERLDGVDLVITSYGSLLRVPWLAETNWRLAILDEAQAIKNPGAKQTRAVKQVKAGARLALTGTPVENSLGDLWSIFDFINPGLLGNAKQFTGYAKSLAKKKHVSYAPLRELVRPYILRRLKTDRSVISDLPDKTEVKAFCGLSRRQAALYEQSVKDLARQLGESEGIQRKGLVLSFLMRFKQICNHPSQWLGDGGWSEADSGKLARLREISETVAAKQEKMLVFTQFREVTAPLAAFLGSVFGAPGLVLHGETDVKKRKELVRRFQEEESEPFFVLSLKAGGSGLNLTAASHVVHFDRWWNPAVENQATDRAFRIGQTKNVLVHKFVCRGTVEEKIDELIESKRKLSNDMLEGGADLLLTEMNDNDLLNLVALDLNKALKES
ncbi:MAG TPA: DEAD/DEAH box helicase [Candidatus Sulfopaludibacter sp.]|jgi:non-specific serine/threonine protein kinase|nr:DEAD/DEAH box helicase [Candidatus Sulfopaludibacter sp.]